MVILLFPKGVHPLSPAIKWHQVLLAWSSFLVVLIHFSRGKGGRASTIRIAKVSVCCGLHFLSLVRGYCVPILWNHSWLCSSDLPAAFHLLAGGRRRLFLCAWVSCKTAQDNVSLRNYGLWLEGGTRLRVKVSAEVGVTKATVFFEGSGAGTS